MTGSGEVKFFKTDKGFGFIAVDGGGPDLFVHAKALRGSGVETLTQGQRVTFDTEDSERGPRAKNVKVA